MKLALDPALLAWALAPQGRVARALLLERGGVVPAPAVARLRAARPHLEAATGLGRGELWDLLATLLERVEALDREDYAEFVPLAERLVGAACAEALAVGLACEVDALAAGGPGFEAQRLLPVLRAWPGPRQGTLPA